MPLVAQRLTINDWNIVVDRVQERLASWKERWLSFSGRILIIKASLATIPICTMVEFQIPDKIAKILEAVHCTFLWGGSEGSSKYNLVKWNEVCKPIRLGGLGIRNCVSIIKTKVIWKLGNGFKIRFWYDSWLAEKAVRDMANFRPLVDHFEEVIGEKVCDYMRASPALILWNISLERNRRVFQEHELVLDSVWDRIESALAKLGEVWRDKIGGIMQEEILYGDAWPRFKGLGRVIQKGKVKKSKASENAKVWWFDYPIDIHLLVQDDIKAHPPDS
ncbi:hypothetical protein SUGI_0218450 [Cryptomeria japonica]|nr:hypothetical protein SUGI_0218450 [Cryptomeria japonica]